MTEKENTLQEAAEELLCDPDNDADKTPPPAPPQTIANEPGGEEQAKR